MALTPAQLATFKADILSNQAANVAAGDHGAIVEFYNANGTGNIWRPSIPTRELNNVIDWSAFASLTVARQNTYFAMTQADTVDATKSTIRSGFATIFSAGSTTTTALSGIAQRTPTRFEQLFVSSSASAVFGYRITTVDVVLALNEA